MNTLWDLKWQVYSSLLKCPKSSTQLHLDIHENKFAYCFRFIFCFMCWFPKLCCTYKSPGNHVNRCFGSIFWDRSWYFPLVRWCHYCWFEQHLNSKNIVIFPCGSAGEESTCNVGDLGSIPELGRSPGEGNGYPLQYSDLENSMDYIVYGVAESDTTERLSLFSLLETKFYWEIHSR